MQEYFLHFIWRNQYFDKHNLCTTDHESLEIFSTGDSNQHSGPDFSGGRAKIEGLEWYGFIEIHIKASDWLRHHHHKDPAYNNVILHVVWQNDRKIHRQDGSSIPTLELKNRVTFEMIDRYQNLSQNKLQIPCSNQWASTDEAIRLSMFDKAIHNRLENKAQIFDQLLLSTANNWEETAYRWLLRNFGFKINNKSFEYLAQLLPLPIIKKHTNNIIQLEALLFGQAGFLDNVGWDVYQSQLSREYKYLAHKYDLYESRMKRHQWRFLRLRPANFPTVRMAQLAQILYLHANLFAIFRDTSEYYDFELLFNVEVSDYWQNHYDFGKRRNRKANGIGKSSIDSLLINAAVPILTTYGKRMDDKFYLEKAVKLLQSVGGEDNHITRKWKKLGLRCHSAFDSQAMIELFNSFCINKRCLSCNIGIHLIKAV